PVFEICHVHGSSPHIKPDPRSQYQQLTPQEPNELINEPPSAYAGGVFLRPEETMKRILGYSLFGIMTALILGLGISAGMPTMHDRYQAACRKSPFFTKITHGCKDDQRFVWNDSAYYLNDRVWCAPKTFRSSVSMPGYWVCRTR
ncbi:MULTISPECIES: hypothetical protein, partial [Acidiphilium]|uniref:hypothetical protein n=1 Tax=Acidiphilium TaxID=522 RepID=UPI001B80AD7E